MRAPAPAMVVRSPSPRATRSRGRHRRGRREHEAGDRRCGCRRRPGARGARRGEHAGRGAGTTLLRLEPADGAGADALTATASTSRRWPPTRLPGRLTAGRGDRRRRAHRAALLSCWATTSTRPTPRALPRTLSAARTALPGDDPGVLAGELAIMQIFADLLGAVAQPPRPRDPRRPAAVRRRPRGRLRRDGAQPAGVPLRVPALPATPTPRACPSRSAPRLRAGAGALRRHGAGRLRTPGPPTTTPWPPPSTGCSFAHRRACRARPRCCWTCCSGASAHAPGNRRPPRGPWHGSE